MATIEKAILIATMAHAGMKDKAGESYILHPLRVMGYLDPNEENIEEKRMVAVLHDVVEDTPVTYEYLKSYGFSDSVMEGIRSVTKLKGESRMEAVKRTIQNPIGRSVKLADLKDNMDLKRIKNPSEKDLKRMEVYQQIKEFLETNGA